MEKLFHYVWKHRLFPAKSLVTTDGVAVDVVDVGLSNSDAGPDFFNAKVLIDGQMWAGNVELHLKSSQWQQHGHHLDKAYNGVILHVTCEADCEVYNERGEHVPQIVLSIPKNLLTNYDHLLTEDRYPRCYKYFPYIPVHTVHAWLTHLYIERLERKAKDIMTRVEACSGSWEDAFFQTLARNFGFGTNADAFELWARHIPLHSVGHHRDDLFQVEAFFFGQAGLLDPSSARVKQREKMLSDDYFCRLAAEYKFLQKKFSLEPMPAVAWKFLRLRPQAFPTIRLSQLTQLYYNGTAGLSQLLTCDSVKAVEKALSTCATPYWQTHYLFGEESEKSEKTLSKGSKEVIIINTVVPMMYAYGRYRHDKVLRDKAFTLINAIAAEKNMIIRLWQECGLEVRSASDSQALIQLKKEYCDRKDCLRCRIGHQYLRINPANIPPRNDEEDI